MFHLLPPSPVRIIALEALRIMTVERAIWFPYWYELDQSVAVGQEGDFDFFKVAPDYIEHEGLPAFYHGLGERYKTLFDRRRVKILRIKHPILGSIQAIDTRGFDYTFTMSDGRLQKVEAEETPGLVYGRDEPIADWRIYVDIERAIESI
jgi:hypothetical protein